MASKQDRRIALISIHPKYVDLILCGKKRVEFRKIRFCNHISYVVLYATSPTHQIVGYFEVSYLDEDTPRNLWSKYKEIGGIIYTDFASYFQSSFKGIAIGVGELRSFENPFPLVMVKRELKPPQSFLYLSKEDFKKIKRYGKQSPSIV